MGIALAARDYLVLVAACVLALASCGSDPDPVVSGEFQFTPLTVIGDTGDGVVDALAIVAEWNGMYAVSHQSSQAQIQLFDLDGQYLRTIGQEGQGPEEFRSIRDLITTPAGDLLVIDGANARIARLSPDEEVVETYPIPWRPRWSVGGVDLFPDGSLLVNGFALGAGPDAFLHRWNWGEVIWSVRERDPIPNDNGAREAAIDQDGSIWAVRSRGRFRIDHYSAEGDLLASFSPQRDWFDDWQPEPPPQRSVERRERAQPTAWVRDVLVKGSELWVLALTGNPRWWDAGPKARVLRYTDSVIDIYDTKTGELLSEARFHMPGQVLTTFLSDGRVLGFKIDDPVDYLVIWRVEAQ